MFRSAFILVLLLFDPFIVIEKKIICLIVF